MKYNIFAHADMADMKKKHPDWIWNRSDTHVILGAPGSIDAMRTPVEPGNSFSPGPGTYGVSSWLYTDNALHTPEEKPLSELDWSFEQGHLPVLCSGWKAGAIDVKSRLFTVADDSNTEVRDYFSVTLENNSDKEAAASFYLVIRSFGAAGGEIRALSYSENGHININNAPLMMALQAPTRFGAVSYNDSGKDISCYLKNGTMPKITSADDESTWASGALEYGVNLASGESVTFDFVCQLHVDHWMLNYLPPLAKPIDVRSIEAQYLADWSEKLSIRLDLPDKRFADAFYCQLVHLYMFTVHNAPRISPISYPLWWLRDGAYVVNALGKGGFRDFNEQAVREIKGKTAFGGFGSEGDAPGSIIWLISEHYLLTRDITFLRDMWSTVQESADLIIQMRNADKPIKVLSEYLTPYLALEPNMDILCIPTKGDGLINGRMDLHFPLVWVNTFAYFGLRRAAQCAEALGLNAEADKYRTEAQLLDGALQNATPTLFGQNDRDVNCAFWPTGWADRDDKLVSSKFDEFWNTVRCPNGVHQPEELWTYFEAGQAHNNIIRGERERAWVSIEMFLTQHTAPGLYTYHEGSMDENSFLQWQRTRGWDDISYITPHGWTAAELFLLLRDCLIREEENALIIGSGVPKSWLNSDFSAKHLPTHYGEVSFEYCAERRELTVYTEKSGIAEIKHELPWDVRIIEA